MRVKIISDGTSRGLKVVNVETGEPLQYMTSIKWELEAGGWAKATITLIEVPVEIETEAEVIVEKLRS